MLIDEAYVIIHKWQTLIAAGIALIAALITVWAIRRQTDLPLKSSRLEKLRTRKAGLITLQEELKIIIEGIDRLKDGAERCTKDIYLARQFLPFWLHFPRAYDLQKTTLTEVGIDFGPGGAPEFTKVRERLRMMLRLNYSLHRDSMQSLPEARIKEVLGHIISACNVAGRDCENLDSKLTELISDVSTKINLEGDRS